MQTTLKAALCAALCVALLFITSCSVGATPGVNGEDELEGTYEGKDECKIEGEGEIRITATIYPVYALLAPIAEGVPGVSIDCLGAINAGCAHDYQITSNDRKLIHDSDIIVMNGAGMEQFLAALLPQIKDKVIDLSVGERLLAENSALRTSAPNPHIWLSPTRAMNIVNRLAEELARLFPSRADEFASNAAAFVSHIKEASDEAAESLAPYAGANVGLFHEGFEYFADEYHINVAFALTPDPDSPPDARQLASIVASIKDGTYTPPVAAIFTDDEEGLETAGIISRETGVPMHKINTVTRRLDGVPDTDAYVNALQENTRVFSEALK